MTTLPRANLLVSFVIATHDRRDILLSTLAQIYQCGLSRDAFEILLVDNASHDNTAAAITKSFPDVQLFVEKTNRGSCAKNIAIEQASGRFIVILDDDSYPHRDSIARMIRHFERDPLLGAAVFTIHLQDGSRECSAYPDVFIGCGTGFRRRALSQVGGLPNDFFMQGEEYDLSLRLLDAGWTIKSFDDLHVTHLKSPQSRRLDRIMRLDLRNNLILAHRYFPRPWSRRFAIDWMRRYYKIAKSKKLRRSFFLGAMQGMLTTLIPGRRHPISAAAFEMFAKVQEIEDRLRAAKEMFDLRSVLFVDLGKNILPFHLAAKKLDIEIIAIADGKLVGEQYRGIAIIDDADARSRTFDAAIISNLSPVHAENRREQWRLAERFRRVIDLFEDDRFIAADPASGSRQIVAQSA